jgi:predicted phage-related endonuclease
LQEALIRKQVEVLERNQEELVHKAQSMEEMQSHLRHFEEENAANLLEIEKKMKAVEKSMKAFEKELKEQLVKDGYIKKTDEIDHLNVSKEKIDINGKTIKPADERKYRDLLQGLSEKTGANEFIKDRRE